MRIRKVQELHVFEVAYANALRLFALSQAWPKEERYALTDQARRASRAVCANLAEAWAKRLYPRHFVSKLTDALAEVDELGVWVDFARDHGYVSEDDHRELRAAYHQVSGGIVSMIRRPWDWCLSPAVRPRSTRSSV